MNVKSYGSVRYFATFIDDKTRYMEVAFLKSRSDILTKFKKYQLRVEKETGCKIVKLRSDNAKEYISREFSNYLESQGIRRRLSVEYTPQQNRVAERVNRTIVKMARAMLIMSKVPKDLWAEVVNMAVFLRNRCPSKANSNLTPYKLQTGKKSNIKFFRIFGSHVTFLKKGPDISKLDPKGEEAILVGYSNEAKVYRLWIPNITKIIKSRDVRFIEDVDDNKIEYIPVDLLSNVDVRDETEILENVDNKQFV